MGSKAKRVAIIGSSGGGAATLGQGDSYGLLSVIKRELSRAGITVAWIQLVDCEVPLDYADTSSAAALWTLGAEGQVQRSFEGTLWNVNQKALPMDRQLARMIQEDGVDGLVAISADVKGINQQAILAASEKHIPIVGTGGTSLGQAASLSARVIGNSGGSVATTIQSKAVSFAASLAGYWDLAYRPDRARMNVTGPLAGCLPVFITVMIIKALLRELEPWYPTLRDLPDLSRALPLVVCVVVTSQVGAVGDMAVMAGLLGGVIAQGNVATALIIGLLAGHLCRSLLVQTARSTVIPATASTIITVAASGVAAGLTGLIIRYPVAYLTSLLLRLLQLVETPPSSLPLQCLLGAILGSASCYGSQVGLYHSIMLPAILLEMEGGMPSFLGALDLCTLVLVSAGVCLGHLAVPVHRHMTPLARRGATINLLFGDFVEAAYPWMDDDSLISASAYLASSASATLLLRHQVRSSAYLPLPISLWLGGPSLLSPALVAVGIPFVTMAASGLISRR